jgi:hypothetical protein
MYDDRQDAKAKSLSTVAEAYLGESERREERIAMKLQGIDWKRCEAVRVMRARGMFQEPRRRDDGN